MSEDPLLSQTIEYFFTLQSPWSYLGHADFINVINKHGASVDYRPVKLGDVFSETGGLPLAKRHPARQRYRIVELQRWIERSGLPMKLHPKHWPFNTALADKVVIATMASGGAVESILPRFFSAVFEREEDLGDPAVIAGILRETELDADAILRSAEDETTQATYLSNVALALERGAFGAPVYVRDGECFWGQDRLSFLDDALASGRPPYFADA